MFLLVNTSYSPCSFSLVCNKNIALSRFVEQSSSLINSLLVELEDLMNEADLVPEQLEAIVFISGPASYTGTRLGAAIVEGLLTKAPLVPVINLTLFDLICLKIQPKYPVNLAIKGFGQYYYGASCHWLNEQSYIDKLCLVKKKVLTSFGDLIELPTAQEQIPLASKLAAKLIASPDWREDHAEPCYVTTESFWKSKDK